MTTYSFFAIVAAFAYAPLLAVIVAARPWSRRDRHLLLFLAATMVWSLVDALHRSGAVVRHDGLLGTLAIIAFAWTAMQLYTFAATLLSAGHRSWLSLAHACLFGTVVLAAMGYVAGNLSPESSAASWYGRSAALLVVPPLALLARASYLLWRRRMAEDVAPEAREALLAGILTMTVLSLVAALAWEITFPAAHIGSIALAFGLTFAALEHDLVVVRPALRRRMAWVGLGTFAAVCFSILLAIVNAVFRLEVSLAYVLLAAVVALGVAAGSYRLRTLLPISTGAVTMQRPATTGQRPDPADEDEPAEAAEYERELAVINRASVLVTSSLDIQRMYGNLVAELQKIVDISWAAISLIEEDEVRFLALSSTAPSPWATGDSLPIKGTAAERLVRHKTTIVEPDLKREHRFVTDRYHLKQGMRSVVYFPLIVDDRVIGSFVLASRKPGAYGLRHIEVLQRLAAQIAKQVEHSRLYVEAMQMARTDELTGLSNRRALNEAITGEIERCSRYGGVFSLIVLDIDSLKTVNDTLGHMAGDEVLRQVGTIMRATIRNTDQPFRYGGDEFAILLPQTTMVAASEVAERVRHQIATRIKGLGISITASFGLATWPFSGRNVHELMAAADSALYQAKRRGGNRSHGHGEVQTVSGDAAPEASGPGQITGQAAPSHPSTL